MNIKKRPQNGPVHVLEDESELEEVEEMEEEDEESECNTSILADLELRERELQEEFRKMKEEEEKIDERLRESEAARRARENRPAAAERIRELEEEKQYLEEEESELLRQEEELTERQAQTSTQIKALLDREQQVLDKIKKIDSKSETLAQHNEEYANAKELLTRLKKKHDLLSEKEEAVKEKLQQAESLRAATNDKLKNVKSQMDDQLETEENNLTGIKEALRRKVNQLSSGVFSANETDDESTLLIQEIGDISLKQVIHQKLVQRKEKLEAAIAEQKAESGTTQPTGQDTLQAITEEIEEKEEEIRHMKNELANKVYAEEDALKEEEDALEAEMDQIYAEKKEIQKLLDNQQLEERKARKGHNQKLKKEEKMYQGISDYLTNLASELEQREGMIKQLEKRISQFDVAYHEELEKNRTRTEKKRLSLERHRQVLAATKSQSGEVLQKELNIKQTTTQNLVELQSRLSVQKQQLASQQNKFIEERQKLRASQKEAEKRLNDEEEETRREGEAIRTKLMNELHSKEDELEKVRNSARRNSIRQREKRDKISKLMEIFDNTGDDDDDFDAEFHFPLTTPSRGRQSKTSGIMFDSPASLLSLRTASPVDFKRPRVSATPVEKIDATSLMGALSSTGSEDVLVPSPVVVKKRQRRPRRSFNLEDYGGIDFSRVELKRKQPNKGDHVTKAPRMTISSELDLGSDDEIFKPLQRTPRSHNKHRSVLSTGRNKHFAQSVRFDSNIQTTQYEVASSTGSGSDIPLQISFN